MGRWRYTTVGALAAAATAAGTSCGDAPQERQQRRATIPTKVHALSLNPHERRREAAYVHRLIAELARGSTADDPSICDRLFTRRYLEATTDRGAAGALAACRRQVAGEGGRTRLIRIERITLTRGRSGGIAGRVQYVANVDGTTARAVVLVRREPDGYRLDGARLARQAGAAP